MERRDGEEGGERMRRDDRWEVERITDGNDGTGERWERKRRVWCGIAREGEGKREGKEKGAITCIHSAMHTVMYSVTYDACERTAIMNSRCSGSWGSRVRGEGGFLAPGVQGGEGRVRMGRDSEE